jgi:hypothetical protein
VLLRGADVLVLDGATEVRVATLLGEELGKIVRELRYDEDVPPHHGELWQAWVPSGLVRQLWPRLAT